jgi:hypothetical protein
MDVLSTGFAVLALLAAGFLTWQCNSYAKDARAAALELRKSQGTLHAQGLSIANLALQHRRLNGRVNAMKASNRYATEADVDDFANEAASISTAVNGLDPDLAAELALQNAPAVSPGKPG